MRGCTLKTIMSIWHTHRGWRQCPVAVITQGYGSGVTRSRRFCGVGLAMQCGSLDTNPSIGWPESFTGRRCGGSRPSAMRRPSSGPSAPMKAPTTTNVYTEQAERLHPCATPVALSNIAGFESDLPSRRPHRCRCDRSCRRPGRELFRALSRGHCQISP